MNCYKLLMFIIFISFQSALGQTLETEKQRKLQDAKVSIFTPEENANIGRWLNIRVDEMEMNDGTRQEYDRIFYSYIYNMSRLNDKDKDFTHDEVVEKFDEAVIKMNKELKEILSTEQYINHLENFGAIVRNVYNKWERMGMND